MCGYFEYVYVGHVQVSLEDKSVFAKAVLLLVGCMLGSLESPFVTLSFGYPAMTVLQNIWERCSTHTTIFFLFRLITLDH